MAPLSVAQEAQTELAGRVELARLVDLSAFRLGINLEYDANQLREEVTLRLGAGVTDDELWALTNRLLASRGFTSVQPAGEGSLSIVPLASAASLARVEPDVPSATAGFVRSVVLLERLNGATIVEPVRAVLGESGSDVTALAQSQGLLLAGLKPAVLQATAFIEQLESAAAPPQTELVAMRHRQATEVVTLAERALAQVRARTSPGSFGSALATPDERSVLIVAPQGSVDLWRELIDQFDRPPAQDTRTYIVRDHPLQGVKGLAEAVLGDGPVERPGWAVVADELTGALIVTADVDQHRELEGLFERLGASARQVRSELRSFPVEHRASSEVLQMLEQLLSAPAGGEAGLGLGTEGSGGALAEPPPVGGAVPGVGVVLTEDPATNRIVAFGELPVLVRIEELLDVLDVPQTQIQLEVLILTLTESQARDLGVELQKLIPNDDALIQLGSVFGFGGPPIDGALPINPGSGFTAAALDVGSFSALVRALENLSNGRALAIPRVVVNNNQPATLDSVLEQPFLSTNASDTVATTSFGGSSAAGTSIQVTPTIVSGDRLVLSYTVSVSTFVGDSSDPSLPPPRQENSLNSVVTIPNGYTVVAGGIDLETMNDATSRVPLLGQIPFLGQLFRSDSRGRDRTRFYAFLRAEVDWTDRFDRWSAESERLALELDLGQVRAGLEPRLIR